MTDHNSANLESPTSSIEIPASIRPEHKTRWAIVYTRQSSVDQVRNHTGSTASQSALSGHARRWGWPESLIKVIDEDLGLSGTSSNHRTGFQKLLDLMARGDAGIVFVRDASRVSRNPLDSEQFLKNAMRGNTLLWIDGRLYDPAGRDLPMLFGLRIQALLAWYDNEQRVRTLQAAKDARVREGFAVSRPPIGYVQSVRGKWIKDPDCAVQEAVRRVFSLYLELQSARKVAMYLHQHNLLFPRRRHGETQWKFLPALKVLGMLDNPNYTGDYVYRRVRILPGDGDTPPRRRHATPSEWVSYPDHHDPYVTKHEWDLIQRTLHGQGRGPDRRPAAGRGAALLQGLVACSHCEGRWMLTLYDGHSHLPRYQCQRDDKFGATLHRAVCAASLLDPLVVREVLASLSPVSLRAAVTAINNEKIALESLATARQRQLQRAEDHVAQCTRELRHVDPELRRVRIQFEVALEEALRYRDDLKHEQALPGIASVSILSEIDASELVALGAEAHTLWAAPETTNEDKKRLIRTLVSRVVVHSSTSEALDFEIVWVSGSRERRQVLKPRGVRQLLEDLCRANFSVQEIVTKLAEAGLTTSRGKAYSRRYVHQTLRAYGLLPRGDAIQALPLVRYLLLKGHSHPEILETLRSLGNERTDRIWTAERLHEIAAGLLPGRERTPLGLPPEIIELVLRERQSGRTFHAIAEKLNARGLKPLRAAAFTAATISGLFRRFTPDAACASRSLDAGRE